LHYARAAWAQAKRMVHADCAEPAPGRRCAHPGEPEVKREKPEEIPRPGQKISGAPPRAQTHCSGTDTGMASAGHGPGATESLTEIA